MNKKVEIGLIVLGILILLGLITWGTYISIRGPSEIQPDVYSQNRMDQIHRVMSSYFGRNWAYMFIVFGVFILIILFLIYMLSRKGITINISDTNFVHLQRIFFWIAIILSLGVIILGIIAYIKYRKEQNTQNVSAGDLSDDTKAKQLLEVIGMSILFAILLGAVVWFIVRRLKQRNVDKTRSEVQVSARPQSPQYSA